MKSTYPAVTLLLLALGFSGISSAKEPASTAEVASQAKLGDADFPKTSPSARHDAKVTAIKSGEFDLAMIGDSITHHTGGVPKTTGFFSHPLGATFWEDVCTPDRPGHNLGFGADWTQHVLWRIDHGELDGISPKHVVLMIGTNNVLNSTADTCPESIVAGVRACVLRIREKTPDAKLVLMAVLPCRNPATHSNRVLAEKVNLGFAQLAKEAKCDYLDIGASFLDKNGNIPATLTCMTPFILMPQAT